MEKLTGQCLCGAVRIAVTPAKDELHACHCEMCRRWTGSAFVEVDVRPEDLDVTGPVKTRATSDWAERAWCDDCGSTLWYGTLHDGAKHLAAGLFENAADAPLKLEFFVDKCPQGYALAGDHKRLTTDETIALFAPV